MNTYQEFYEGEVRTLKLAIRNNNGEKFLPSSAKAYILNSTGASSTSAGSSASIINNEVYKLVDKITTDVPGDYKILWEVYKDQSIYRHVTELRVSKV